MRYLLFLFSLLLSVSTAFAQGDKLPAVTKLPGEENLTLRERAERDFLMPVRRKKIVAEAAKSTTETNTAAPESDVTAHAGDVADEVRTVEEVAAPAREVRTTHATRRHTAHRSTRSRATHSAHSKAKSSAKKSGSSKKKSSAKKSSAKKSSANKSSKKKSTASKKRRR
jgi:hypothetical protein